MAHIPTPDLLRSVVDDNTWRSWDVPLTDPPGEPAYAADLERARTTTGTDESVTTGSAQVGGRTVAVVAGDFGFLAGSIGRVAADRIVAAFERATALGLPVLGLPQSGGTRMQEGTPAFIQMAAIASAVRSHTDAGLPYLIYLRHPTTGGVLATWGSLGDVVCAQPGALIGFLGPKVYEGLFHTGFPAGVQTAAGLYEAGVIDAVAAPEEWRSMVARILDVWAGRPDPAAPPGWESPNPEVVHRPANPAPPKVSPTELTAWDAITATRRSDRPGAADLVALLPDAVELSGTGVGERAVAIRVWLALVDGTGCVIVGQDRARQEQRRAHHPALGIGPGDLRVARRGMALAQRWRLPLVTIVDTQGAELSAEAEQGALAGEIARCLAELMNLDTATVSLLLGGGGGGGALALLPADRVVAAADAWLTPLPPEGASLIVHGDTTHADAMAEHQHITAADLAAAGAVDRVVGEPLTDLEAWRQVLSEEVARAAAAGPGSLPRAWPRR